MLKWYQLKWYESYLRTNDMIWVLKVNSNKYFKRWLNVVVSYNMIDHLNIIIKRQKIYSNLDLNNIFNTEVNNGYIGWFKRKTTFNSRRKRTKCFL